MVVVVIEVHAQIAALGFVVRLEARVCELVIRPGDPLKVLGVFEMDFNRLRGVEFVVTKRAFPEVSVLNDTVWPLVAGGAWATGLVVVAGPGNVRFVSEVVVDISLGLVLFFSVLAYSASPELARLLDAVRPMRQSGVRVVSVHANVLGGLFFVGRIPVGRNPAIDAAPGVFFPVEMHVHLIARLHHALAPEALIAPLSGLHIRETGPRRIFLIGWKIRGGKIYRIFGA